MNREKSREGFPQNFSVQRIGISAARAIANLSAPEIVKYFRENKFVADQLLVESYDKRYSPSTFITEEGDEYHVGWHSDGYECERRFATLADAATDYLLFSLGKSRWSPPED